MSIGADADGEMLVAQALTALLNDPPVRVVTVLPKTVPDGIVRVTLAPGSVSDYDTSTLRVDVESFAATREAARDLASRVHAGMGWLCGYRVGDQQFDAVSGSFPTWLFWSETRHRFLSTYSIDLRIVA